MRAPTSHLCWHLTRLAIKKLDKIRRVIKPQMLSNLLNAERGALYKSLSFERNAVIDNLQRSPPHTLGDIFCQSPERDVKHIGIFTNKMFTKHVAHGHAPYFRLILKLEYSPWQAKSHI